jgi:hypothetical protein
MSKEPRRYDAVEKLDYYYGRAEDMRLSAAQRDYAKGFVEGIRHGLHDTKRAPVTPYDKGFNAGVRPYYEPPHSNDRKK